MTATISKQAEPKRRSIKGKKLIYVLRVEIEVRDESDMNSVQEMIESAQQYGSAVVADVLVEE